MIQYNCCFSGASRECYTACKPPESVLYTIVMQWSNCQAQTGKQRNNAAVIGPSHSSGPFHSALVCLRTHRVSHVRLGGLGARKKLQAGDIRTLNRCYEHDRSET